MSKVKQLKDPTATAEHKRFNETLALFKKYGARYDFDPLMLAAQGYQESQLNQKAKSHVGAIGVMQLMPATGAEMKVGDITIAESNVHAGTKYMDQLMTRYFREAKFSEGNRPLFAFASYNCGAANVAKARRKAGREVSILTSGSTTSDHHCGADRRKPPPTCATSTSITSLTG